MGIHGQHELTLDTGEYLEQAVQVIFVEHSRIMAHIRAHIGRIHEMKGRRGIESGQHLESVVVFDGTFFEQILKLGQKAVFGSEDPAASLACSAGIGKRTGKYAGESQPAERSYGPGPLDRTEVVRMPVDEPGHVVLFAAVGRAQHLEAQGIEVRHDGTVKVDQLAVKVVDNIDPDWLLGEEQGSASGEDFRIDIMFGQERQDILEHGLLAAVITDGGFHNASLSNGST